jgi:hypothetical protein
MKIAYLILLVIATTKLIAQIDTTRKEFYPLQIGNLWEYRTSDNQIGTMRVSGDTTFDGDYRILQGAIIDGVQYGTIVSVNDIAETLPEKIILHQNYPNPFNPSSTIRYEISKTTNINLKIINILGEEIDVLVNEIKYPGSYETEFNANHLSSGVYIAVLQTTEAQLSKAMLLIK